MIKSDIVKKIEVEFNVKFDLHVTSIRGNMIRAEIPVDEELSLSVLYGTGAHCNKNTVEVCVVGNKEFYVGTPEDNVSFKRLKEIVSELKKS